MMPRDVAIAAALFVAVVAASAVLFGGVGLSVAVIARGVRDCTAESAKRADRLPLLFPDCRLPAADCPPEAP